MIHGRLGDLHLGVVDIVPVHLLGPQPGDVALVIFRDARLGGAATVDVEADLAEGGRDALGFVFDVEQLVAESYQQFLLLFDLLFDLFDFVVVSVEGFGDTLLFLIFREEHFDFVYLFGCEVFGSVAGGCRFDLFEDWLEVMEEVVGGGAVLFSSDAHHSKVEESVLVVPSVDVEVAAHAHDDVAFFHQVFHWGRGDGTCEVGVGFPCCHVAHPYQRRTLRRFVRYQRRVEVPSVEH